MREMIKLVFVLTVLSSLSGGLLAAIRSGTQERIKGQVLQFVQGPAIRSIMAGASNDPITDRFTLEINGKEQNFFVGKFDGKAKLVAFETQGPGYGGDVGMMVAVDLESGKFSGVSVTTHNETPGMGARIQTDKDFNKQFVGLPVNSAPKVNKDGGAINAMSGATITSRAATVAVTRAGEIYEQNQSKIKDKAQTFSG